ncbi:MAG: FkbM family methyltransferase [Thermoflexales bacterium]
MSKAPLWIRLLRWYSLHTPFHRGTYRAALWLYQHLPIPDMEVETTLDRTLRVTLRLPIWVDYNIYTLGFYEAPLVRFFARSLRPDTVFLDIGAYIGQYTLLAAKYAPQGQVIACEPHPESFARLAAHLSRNHLKNAFALQRAVGGQRVERALLCLSDQISDSEITLQPSDESFIEVPMITLDEIVHEFGLQKVDLVKIDVEGMEGAVLRGAEETLSRFRPLLIIELDRSREEVWGDSPEAILTYLERMGYALHFWAGWRIRPLLRHSIGYANVIAIPREGLK